MKSITLRIKNILEAESQKDIKDGLEIDIYDFTSKKSIVVAFIKPKGIEPTANYNKVIEYGLEKDFVKISNATYNFVKELRK